MCHYIGDKNHAVCLTCWEEVLRQTPNRERHLAVTGATGMAALAVLTLRLVITFANQVGATAQRMLKALDAQ
jgi:hypothetical protein